MNNVHNLSSRLMGAHQLRPSKEGMNGDGHFRVSGIRGSRIRRKSRGVNVYEFPLAWTTEQCDGEIVRRTKAIHDKRIALIEEEAPGATSCSSSIAKEICAGFLNRGWKPTGKQFDLLRKLVKGDAERAKRAEEFAAKVASGKVQPVPTPTGERAEITGRVVSTKSTFGDYGEQLKMLIECEEGYKLWGTIPSALIRQVGHYTELRGKVVAFKAVMAKSNRDEYFGFWSRPTSPRLVD